MQTFHLFLKSSHSSPPASSPDKGPARAPSQSPREAGARGAGGEAGGPAGDAGARCPRRPGRSPHPSVPSRRPRPLKAAVSRPPPGPPSEPALGAPRWAEGRRAAPSGPLCRPRRPSGWKRGVRFLPRPPGGPDCQRQSPRAGGGAFWRIRLKSAAEPPKPPGRGDGTCGAGPLPGARAPRGRPGPHRPARAPALSAFVRPALALSRKRSSGSDAFSPRLRFGSRPGASQLS